MVAHVQADLVVGAGRELHLLELGVGELGHGLVAPVEVVEHDHDALQDGLLDQLHAGAVELVVLLDLLDLAHVEEVGVVLGEAVRRPRAHGLDVLELAGLQRGFVEVQAGDLVDLAVLPDLVADELLQVVLGHAALLQRAEDRAQVLLDHLVAVQDLDAQLALVHFEDDVNHADVLELHVVALDLLVLEELAERLVLGAERALLLLVHGHEEQLGLQVEVDHLELAALETHVGELLDQEVVVLDELEADVLLVGLQVDLLDADVQLRLHQREVEVQQHRRVDHLGRLLLEPLLLLVFVLELHLLLLEVADQLLEVVVELLDLLRDLARGVDGLLEQLQVFGLRQARIVDVQIAVVFLGVAGIWILGIGIVTFITAESGLLFRVADTAYIITVITVICMIIVICIVTVTDTFDVVICIVL